FFACPFTISSPRLQRTLHHTCHGCFRTQGDTAMAYQSRPVIGLNMDMIPASKTTRAQFRLHVGYADSVLAAGGLPIVMPPYGSEREVNAFLDRVEGFVL